MKYDHYRRLEHPGLNSDSECEDVIPNKGYSQKKKKNPMESQSLSSPAGLRDLPVQLHRSRADSQRNQMNGLRSFRSLAEELGTRPKLPDSKTVVVTRSNDR